MNHDLLSIIQSIIDRMADQDRVNRDMLEVIQQMDSELARMEVLLLLFMLAFTVLLLVLNNRVGTNTPPKPERPTGAHSRDKSGKHESYGE